MLSQQHNVTAPKTQSLVTKLWEKKKISRVSKCHVTMWPTAKITKQCPIKTITQFLACKDLIKHQKGDSYWLRKRKEIALIPSWQHFSKMERRVSATAKKCNWIRVCQLCQLLPCSHVANVNTVPLSIQEREICDGCRQEFLLCANTNNEGSIGSEEGFEPRSQTCLQTAQTTEIHFCGTEQMDTIFVKALLWLKPGN
jgi:hypothetical protein